MGIIERSDVNVLVVCEFTQIVTQAFLKEGYNAYSCDLLETEGDKSRHYLGDCRPLLKQDHWDLIICHPGCTRLTNAGIRWLKGPGEVGDNPPKSTPAGMGVLDVWAGLYEGVNLFGDCLAANAPHVAIENPTMHYVAKERIPGFREHSQAIQPWQFGHIDKKRICLWLQDLPDLKPTDIVPKELRKPTIHFMGPSATRGKDRSRFFDGIAEAMAKQWGRHVHAQKLLRNS